MYPNTRVTKSAYLTIGISIKKARRTTIDIYLRDTFIFLSPVPKERER